MAELKCTCKVRLFVGKPPLIEYCPLHKSAEELYEACKELQIFIIKTRQPNRHYTSPELDSAYTKILADITKALAKAEGGIDV